MNKDMINIDDFVREKLGGHTEKEDPAAWLRMQALLDKEMPERAVPFLFRLGKPAAFIGAALLIGVLCVGGYQLGALRDKNAAADASAALNVTYPAHHNNQTQAPDNTISPKTNHSNNTPGKNPITAENNIAENNIAGNNYAENKENGSVTEHGPDAPQGRTRLASSSRPGTITQKQESTLTTVGHKQGLSRTKRPADSGESAISGASNRTLTDRGTDKREQQLAAQQKSGTQAETNRTTKAIDKEAPLQHEKQTADRKQQRILAGNMAVARKHDNTKQLSSDKTVTTQPENKDAGESATDKAPSSNTNSQDKELKLTADGQSKDSMAAITVVTKESASKGYPKKVTRLVDTVAINMVPVRQEAKQAVPVNNTIISTVRPSKKTIRLAAAESKKANKLASMAEAEHQKNILASGTANKDEPKESTNGQAKESVLKIRKQQNSLSRWIGNLNLQQAVADAKRDAGNAQFFGGFTGGINYTVAKTNDFQGVQFGPTGELVFNKHWSLFGAVKYFNRSGGKKTINDQFSKEVSNNIADSTRGANYYFTVITDSTNRSFRFSTVHSFEMPVSVRYAIRKLYLMAGINFAYYLPINVEQTEQNSKNTRALITNTTYPILNETKPVLSTGDFGSRFGIGYVFGAGYQISPAWQVDLSMVNSFWDNAKGEGAKKLSKDFYRLPSVQLSIGCQFNRGRSKPTFGPTSAP